MKDTLLCPCQSGKLYSDCCEPFHLRKLHPTTAEQLMRSRYTAYTQLNIDYIVATTVPNQQLSLDRKMMMKWSKTTQWKGLEIVQHNPKFSKNHATVEFKALFKTDNGQDIHHELSLFVKINDCWFFVDPNVTIPKKQLCFCGSGKKFKQCCGILI
ncbi:YchJ family protein [Otariodibacter sp.]|uniref:YchJ family protein n=1 Tax=Otariodibacter sp. TaxID=3030919 RepID=UPI00262C8AD6|nr:YchJ family protein [Otariodibacter sp.]